MLSLILRNTTCAVVAGLLFALFPTTSGAVNFATGAKAKPGYQLSLYPFFYAADTRTDNRGDSLIDDLGLKKYGFYLSNSYYAGDFLLNTVIPVGRVEIDRFDSSDAGLGDIQLRAGWFTPIEWATVMPALMVKLPSGSYDSDRPANLGDGQTDLVAELYLHKLSGPFSFDATLKYSVRFRNRDSDLTPGNELAAEMLATWRLADKIRVGPALNFTIGEDNEQAGETLTDSGLRRLSAGAELYYGRLDRAKFSVAVYRDLSTRNTSEGYLVISRIVCNF